MGRSKRTSKNTFGLLKNRRSLQLRNAQSKRSSLSVDTEASDIALIDSSSNADGSILSGFGRKHNLFQGIATESSTSTIVQASKFCIVDITLLSSLLKGLCCPLCSHQKLTILKANTEKGFAESLQTVCDNCGEVNSSFTSPRLGNSTSRDVYEVNRRAVTAFMEMGTGYAGMEKFCRVMNMTCMHHATFNSHVDDIAAAAVKTCEETLQTSGKLVRQAYKDIDPDLENVEIINISVSYDASWMKRGHTSHFGIGSCIDLLTGLILDYEVMSSFCKRCSTAQATMDDEEFQAWQLSHKDECDQNHHGTAGSMEVKSAETLWMRSIAKHNLRYTTMLSDGDSKSFIHLKELSPYGKDCIVTKEECINHVNKRMGTALRKLAKETKVKGVVLGGRGWGKLTEGTINKLTMYYGKAIRSNSHNLDNMRDAVFATFLHSLSTDEDPHHSRCPKGSSSWCFFNRAIANNSVPDSHKENTGTPLTREVAEHVRTVYEHLGDPALLSRCLQGKTQNTNESFHSVIWRMCPKTFLCKKRVTAGVAQAVMQYNRGLSSTELILKELTIQPGNKMEEGGKKKDLQQLSCNLKRSMQGRKRKKVAKLDDSAGAY